MRVFAGVALTVALAPAALSQHQTFVVNPDASEVKIKLNTTHEVVNGTFHVHSEYFARTHSGRRRPSRAACTFEQI